MHPSSSSASPLPSAPSSSPPLFFPYSFSSQPPLVVAACPALHPHLLASSVERHRTHCLAAIAACQTSLPLCVHPSCLSAQAFSSCSFWLWLTLPLPFHSTIRVTLPGVGPETQPNQSITLYPPPSFRRYIAPSSSLLRLFSSYNKLLPSPPASFGSIKPNACLRKRPRPRRNNKPCNAALSYLRPSHCTRLLLLPPPPTIESRRVRSRTIRSNPTQFSYTPTQHYRHPRAAPTPNFDSFLLILLFTRHTTRFIIGPSTC